MRHPLALRARFLRLALIALVVVAAVGLGTHNVQANDDAYGFDPDELMDEIDPCFFNSPVKQPFLQKLPIPPPAQQAPSDVANTDKYEIHEVAATTEIIPGIKTPVWHYVDATASPTPFPPDGEVETMIGPTILARRGVPVDVRWVNNLPPDEDGTSMIDRSSSGGGHAHGLPSSTVVHLHGINTDHTSDGFPDFADGHEHRKVPGQAHLFHYPNNDRNRGSTLWYHDHSVHHTSTHIYRGLAGLYVINDPQEERLNLPKGYGLYDVPLAIKDVMIDPATGKLVYDNCQEEGAYGDVMTVNGKQQPFHEVGTRKYRFRILNASDARQYWLALRPASRINDPSADIPFLVIGSDHGLLAAPKPARRVHASPAERVEIVVDFAAHLGQRLVLVNTLVQTDSDLRKLAPIMAFDVTRAEVDESTVPPVLSEDHAIQPPVETRSFRFDRSNSLYTINSLIWDPQRADAKPVRDTVERWRLVNNSGGWGHPIHLHLGKAKIVAVDGRRLRPDESGWKDTVWVGPNQTVTIDQEFYNFGGRFAFHCHNASHEDHDMMSNFQVQPVPPDGI